MTSNGTSALLVHMPSDNSPQSEFAWSLGTTILQRQPPQGRCVCAFDSSGRIYYEALGPDVVGRFDNHPPGALLRRNEYGRWRRAEGDAGDWRAAARSFARPWSVEPGIDSECDWGQWRSSGIFPCVLEWYPDAGEYRPSAPANMKIPRRPGCWLGEFNAIEREQRTSIVRLMFSLSRERHRQRVGNSYHHEWRYRSPSDQKFQADWVIKFNGHEHGGDPPGELPVGTILAVFLAHGNYEGRWNPNTGQSDDFVHLKIGSVLSMPG